jgi:hypothetical protein
MSFPATPGCTPLGFGDGRKRESKRERERKREKERRDMWAQVCNA